MKHYTSNRAVCATLLTLSLLTPFSTKADGLFVKDNGDLTFAAKAGLTCAGVFAGAVGGKWLYDTCIRERTDAEEVAASEQLYHQSYADHRHISCQYEAECCLAQSLGCSAQASCALKNLVYKAKRGSRYPFTEYARSLDNVMYNLNYTQNSLIKGKNQVRKRSLILQSPQADPMLSGQQRAYFLDEYARLYAQLSTLEVHVNNTTDALCQVKQQVVASEEYTQEKLLARLDQLENKINQLNSRPTTSVVYVQGNGRRCDEVVTNRLDHLEAQVSFRV